MSFYSFRENSYIMHGKTKINAEQFQKCKSISEFKLE